MQTISDLYRCWKDSVHAESNSSLLESAYHRLAEPLSLLEYERTHREEADRLLFRYSVSMNFQDSALSDEMLILLHLRIQAGCELASFLAHSKGMELVERKAQDWIRFLTIDSWHEFLVYKWHILYSRRYSK
jgi:hypothetical protein